MLRSVLRRFAANTRSFSGLATASGAPDKHLKTTATISIPARVATQQGIANTEKWVLKFDRMDRQWTNPLMGWTSGKQTDKQIKLRFNSKEDAINYCESQGKRLYSFLFDITD
eukprot:1268971-Amorphochlora_amoeboformis.AAC.1